MNVQITLQYWLTFNLTKNEVLEFYVEVHSRGQSLMNQNWGLDNVFLFNNQGGTWENYIYKVNSILNYLSGQILLSPLLSTT